MTNLQLPMGKTFFIEIKEKDVGKSIPICVEGNTPTCLMIEKIVSQLKKFQTQNPAQKSQCFNLPLNIDNLVLILAYNEWHNSNFTKLDDCINLTSLKKLVSGEELWKHLLFENDELVGYNHNMQWKIIITEIHDLIQQHKSPLRSTKSQEVLPEHLTNKLHEISQLKDNWNGPYTFALNTETLNFAKLILLKIGNTSLGYPFLYPDIGGEACMLWFDKKILLVVDEEEAVIYSHPSFHQKSSNQIIFKHNADVETIMNVLGTIVN